MHHHSYHHQIPITNIYHYHRIHHRSLSCCSHLDHKHHSSTIDHILLLQMNWLQVFIISLLALNPLEAVAAAARFEDTKSDNALIVMYLCGTSIDTMHSLLRLVQCIDQYLRTVYRITYIIQSMAVDRLEISIIMTKFRRYEIGSIFIILYRNSKIRKIVK